MTFTEWNGTLKQKDLLQKDIESIRKASALEVKIVLATGRPFNSTYEDLKRLGLYDKEDEYTISVNGGVLTENRGNRVLYRNAMSFEKASQIYQCGLKYGTCIHVYTLDTVYVYNYFPDERKYIEESCLLAHFIHAIP